MSDIDKRLDEILDPPAYGFSAEFSCPECMFDFKEAKQAIKQLMADEFEKLTKMYYASPDKSEYQAGYNSALDELRQKLEEWKK